MTRLATLFTCSFRRLKEVRTVTVCAMLGAIAIVLGSLSIDLGPSVRIGFSGIPNELVHYLFGPAAGSLFAGALDILKYMIKPVGGFFPGVIYGSFYYRKPLSLGRVFAAHLVVSLVCNVLLNTLCLSLLYGKAFMVLLPPRVIKNLIMWPIDSLIFFHIAKLLEAAGIFRFLGGRDQNRL